MGSRSFGTKGHPNGEVFTDYNGNTRICLYDGTAAVTARGNVRRIGYDATNNRLAAVAPSTSASQQQIVIAAEPVAAGAKGEYYVKGDAIYVIDSTYFTTGTYTADYAVTMNVNKVTTTGAAPTYSANEFGVVTTAGTSSCSISLWGVTVSNNFIIGKLSSTTAGLGMTVDGSARSYAMRIFTDDGAAAQSAAYTVAAANFRHVTLASVQTESEQFGIRAQHVISAGATLDHNDAAVLGSKEITTTAATLTGTEGDNIHAAVLGRIGVTVTGTTVSATGVLAGLASMSSVTSGYVTVTSGGVLAGVYVGAHTSAQKYAYGMYAENVLQGAYLNSNAGTISSGDAIGVDIAHTGTMSSGEGLVGLQCKVTTAGTAGNWATGIFASVTQTTTKHVNGYVTGAEFEVNNSTAAPSYLYGLTLNINDSGTTVPSASAYIGLRNYGSQVMNNLLWIADHTIGATSVSTLVSTNTATAATHSIKCVMGATGQTPLYILCSNTVV